MPTLVADLTICTVGSVRWDHKVQQVPVLKVGPPLVEEAAAVCRRRRCLLAAAAAD